MSSDEWPGHKCVECGRELPLKRNGACPYCKALFIDWASEIDRTLVERNPPDTCPSGPDDEPSSGD